MAQYVVEKSPPLAGETTVQRSKNAVLPMMACCLMTQDCIELSGVPRLTDVDCMASLPTTAPDGAGWSACAPRCW